ncbi:5-formyltetrahydrofolate cyclo-ligase [Amycolatopsis suaedae]|uniref:5-formyltetrahydrofolate cyclo-ligase n=2 Tax=Amycolatopsis suaedae TaxID=2510978 RepID=A0A4Q7J8T9_9PSEU|nr:5-formyltetrahydrofolate cyclo-ligase [Amycolatopsis suaedae]
MTKAQWRKRLLAARADVPMARRVAEAASLVRSLTSLPEVDVVCGYLPFGTEPGSIALLDELRRTGRTVLLPVIPDVPGPLEWAAYTGSGDLVPGRLRGVLEPAGERLGVTAVASAGLVLVPALAVDHRGVRLGRGAGYYDRSLELAADAELIALVRDDEFVPELPTEPHDVRMNGVLLPDGGWVRTPTARPGAS